MASSQAAEQLYTLTQVSEKTGISMPTLQRYKKLYQNRIPSKGSGRSQRYPESALEVFQELKKENIGRRGRPRKTEAGRKAMRARSGAPKKSTRKAGSKKKATASSSGSELLTLTQIGKLTGISYPTLLRYVKTNLKQIPHKGTGRARRFLPEAVDVFNRLRGESRRGRQSGKTAQKHSAAPRKARGPGRKKAAAATGGAPSGEILSRIKDLEKTNKDLQRTIARLEKQLTKPFRVVLQR